MADKISEREREREIEIEREREVANYLNNLFVKKITMGFLLSRSKKNIC